MDPNANLAELLQLIEEHYRHPGRTDTDRLVDLFAGLDSWIRMGGTLPDSWQKERTPCRWYRFKIRTPEHDTPYTFDTYAGSEKHATEKMRHAFPNVYIVSCDVISNAQAGAGPGEVPDDA